MGFAFSLPMALRSVFYKSSSRVLGRPYKDKIKPPAKCLKYKICKIKQHNRLLYYLFIYWGLICQEKKTASQKMLLTFKGIFLDNSLLESKLLIDLPLYEISQDFVGSPSNGQTSGISKNPSIG